MASIAAPPFSGTYQVLPVPSSFGFAVRHSGVFWYRGSLSNVSGTHTSFDRREFGFEWQMRLPGGGDAVGRNVEVDIDLLLKREDADAEG